MARHARLQNPIISTHADRNSPSPSVHGQRVRVRFSDAAQAYIASGGEGRYLIRSPLLASLADVFVCDIDQHMIDAIAQSLWQDSSPATRSRQCYGPISAVLKFSARQHWCAHWRLKRPKLRKEMSPLPSKADLWKFVHSCQPHLKHVVIFLLRTGADVSETLRLGWVDVDLIRKAARLRSSTGRIRVVNLDEMIIKRLEQTPCALRTGNVFLTHRGKPYSPKRSGGGQLKSALAKSWEKAGIKITPATLKRIWRARQRGEWLEVEVVTEEAKNIVSELLNPALTKYREYS
ncbi:integrase [Bradyrhizobium sp. AZCC 2262]|uniref:hypothetical protein n=1 Tax=Bradyrhizobium sp. AZCC 2262 TaxID=3117022 RepID=UPI002FF009AF